METILQKIKKSFDKEQKAFVYYSIISVINKLGLTKRQIQLLAFTAIRGSITNPAAKSDFCTKYDSSLGTINNMISDLREMGIFIKTGNKISINPVLNHNFDKDIIITTCLTTNPEPLV